MENSEKEFLEWIEKKVPETTHLRMIDFWFAIRLRAQNQKVYAPQVMELYEDAGAWLFAWANNTRYIGIEFSKDGSFYFFTRNRKNGQYEGDEVSEIPERILDLIIEWRPSKDEDD